MKIKTYNPLKELALMHGRKDYVKQMYDRADNLKSFEKQLKGYFGWSGGARPVNEDKGFPQITYWTFRANEVEVEWNIDKKRKKSCKFKLEDMARTIESLIENNEYIG